MKIKFFNIKLIFSFVYIVLLSPVASTEIKKLVTHGGFAFETVDGQKNGAVYISFFNNSNQNFIINSVKTEVAIKSMFDDLYISNVNPGKICSLRYYNPVGAHPSGLIGEDPI